jgi:hypothetical protein
MKPQCSPLALANLAILLLITTPASAQTATDAGRSLWDSLVSVLYGWPGIVVGLVILVVAIFFWLKEGFMVGIAVASAGVILFFLPAGADWMQKEGAKTSPTPVTKRQ